DRGALVDNGDGTWTWSGTGDEDLPYNVTVTARNADGNSASTSFAVSFTDVPPTVTSLAHSADSGRENLAASNSGAFSDYDDALTITADRGALVDNGDGSWTWSGTGDEDHPYSVTVTATNADGGSVSTSFGVSFTDVPPTVTSLAHSA